MKSKERPTIMGEVKTEMRKNAKDLSDAIAAEARQTIHPHSRTHAAKEPNNTSYFVLFFFLSH